MTEILLKGRKISIHPSIHQLLLPIFVLLILTLACFFPGLLPCFGLMWLTHLLDFHNILVEVPYDPSHSANKQNTQSEHNITRARGHNTFFMLNSFEHEILNAYKYKDIKKLSISQAQISLKCCFSCS